MTKPRGREAQLLDSGLKSSRRQKDRRVDGELASIEWLAGGRRGRRRASSDGRTGISPTRYPVGKNDLTKRSWNLEEIQENSGANILVSENSAAERKSQINALGFDMRSLRPKYDVFFPGIRLRDIHSYALNQVPRHSLLRTLPLSVVRVRKSEPVYEAESVDEGSMTRSCLSECSKILLKSVPGDVDIISIRPWAVGTDALGFVAFKRSAIRISSDIRNLEVGYYGGAGWGNACSDYSFVEILDLLALHLFDFKEDTGVHRVLERVICFHESMRKDKLFDDESMNIFSSKYTQKPTYQKGKRKDFRQEYLQLYLSDLLATIQRLSKSIKMTSLTASSNARFPFMYSNVASSGYGDNDIKQMITDLFAIPEFNEGLTHLLENLNSNAPREPDILITDDTQGILNKRPLLLDRSYEKVEPTNDSSALDFSNAYAVSAQCSGFYSHSSSLPNKFQYDASSLMNSPFEKYPMNEECKTISEEPEMLVQLALQILDIDPIHKAHGTEGVNSQPIEGTNLAGAAKFRPSRAGAVTVKEVTKRTAKGQRARKAVKAGGVQKKKGKVVEKGPVTQHQPHRKPQIYDPNLVCFYAGSGNGFGVGAYHSGPEWHGIRSRERY
ncbi:hypothetical protein BDN70DRAFT_898325 [Pholiota conissans]|uniref:Uncharacterized protein n=1 Tax=Pholiota conissans TaxID=109636 RepID=A0A9P6CQM8_9AGAR|nr:hypothetical protein BDN70DRAFT_898325 [Pholiota conissans]